MDICIREITLADAERCGEICYNAFTQLALEHNFTPDLPSVEFTQGMMKELITHPHIYGVVAEIDGCLLGSNFLDERAEIAGIGPITVTTEQQSSQVGRHLMAHILERAEQYSGVRLVQSAYNNRSLSLYAKLGFDLQVPLALMQGSVPQQQFPRFNVRPATREDLPACNALCRQVHGHDRARELEDCITLGWATVVEADKQLVGYSSAIGFMGHSIATSNDALKALISNADEIMSAGILIPATNAELFRWCLANGLRVIQVMNLMSKGLYHTPQGSFIPSVMF